MYDSTHTENFRPVCYVFSEAINRANSYFRARAARFVFILPLLLIAKMLEVKFVLNYAGAICCFKTIVAIK